MNELWILWLGVSIGGFAILETIALLSKNRGDTLSERLREWGRVHTKTATWLYVALATTTLVAVWLPGHILGWWP